MTYCRCMFRFCRRAFRAHYTSVGTCCFATTTRVVLIQYTRLFMHENCTHLPTVARIVFQVETLCPFAIRNQLLTTHESADLCCLFRFGVCPLGELGVFRCTDVEPVRRRLGAFLRTGNGSADVEFFTQKWGSNLPAFHTLMHSCDTCSYEGCLSVQIPKDEPAAWQVSTAWDSQPGLHFTSHVPFRASQTARPNEVKRVSYCYASHH